MKIDPRFQRSCASERIRAERKRKQELSDKIASIIRTSPESLAMDIYHYAHTQKLNLLGVLI